MVMATKSNRKPLNAGIVGCGFIGRIHIEALRRLGYVHVLALASRNQEIADTKAIELTVPRAYGKWSDLMGMRILMWCTSIQPTNFTTRLQWRASRREST